MKPLRNQRLVRLTDDQLEAAEAEAERQGLRLSTWIRTLVLQALNDRPAPKASSPLA